MAMYSLLPHGEDRQAVAAFLKILLHQGMADAIYVPMRTPQGDGVAPMLVRNADLLDNADPLAPVMLINGARAAAALTVGGAPGRIAAVLRPCEIRALIELVKLKQASLERLTIIGMDCTGTYEVGDYARLNVAGGDPVVAGVSIRHACQMCEYPVPSNAQITIGHIGVDGLMVEMDEEMAARLGIAQSGGGLLSNGTRRQEAVQRLIGEHTAQRDATMAAFRTQMADAAALAGYFATCQRCLNCMVACPICYCKECLFRTAAFEHEPGSYLRLAERKGATRLPADTVLFHLTRLNHMSTSCVGCGLCESACPSDIPLTALFRTVGAHTQALFSYIPGRSLDDEIPLMTFREAELEGVK